jgi:hypothetical protein
VTEHRERTGPARDVPPPRPVARTTAGSRPTPPADETPLARAGRLLADAVSGLVAGPRSRPTAAVRPRRRCGTSSPRSRPREPAPAAVPPDPARPARRTTPGRAVRRAPCWATCSPPPPPGCRSATRRGCARPTPERPTTRSPTRWWHGPRAHLRRRCGHRRALRGALADPALAAGAAAGARRGDGAHRRGRGRAARGAARAVRPAARVTPATVRWPTCPAGRSSGRSRTPWSGPRRRPRSAGLRTLSRRMTRRMARSVPGAAPFLVGAALGGRANRRRPRRWPAACSPTCAAPRF